MAEWGGRASRRDQTTRSGVDSGRRGYDASARWRYNATPSTSSGSWANKAKPGRSDRRAVMVAKQVKDDLLDASGQLKLGRRHRPDYLIFLLAVGLAVFGIVIIYSISSGLYDGDTQTINREMFKRVGFLLIGVIAFLLASRISLNVWKKWSPYIFLAGLLICIALPILGWLNVPIATCALGACRWYDLGITSFQPAELLKLGTVLFMAGYLSTRLANGRLDSRSTLIEVLVVMLLALGAIVGLQKDMGTGIALLAIFAMQLYMSGMAMRQLVIIAGVMLALMVALIIVAPHRIERMMTYFQSGNEETDYHITQALIGLGSGGLTGRGLGQSVQAFGWLPEAVNDSIFAIIGETLGFIGASALVIVFAWLIARMFKKTNYLDNMYLRLVVAGVVGWFTAHVLLNIMAMTHIIPLTGITLPLVSSGGTSQVFVMISLGLVFGISRYTSHRQIAMAEVSENKTGGADEDSVRGRWQRWSHNANRGGNK